MLTFMVVWQPLAPPPIRTNPSSGIVRPMLPDCFCAIFETHTTGVLYRLSPLMVRCAILIMLFSGIISGFLRLSVPGSCSDRGQESP